MIDVASFPIHQVLGVFSGNNLVFTMVGVGGFLLSTVGSMMIKCILSKRRDRKKFQKQQKEIQDVTKKALQDNISCFEKFKLLFRKKKRVIRPKTRRWINLIDSDSGSDDDEVYHYSSKDR